MIIALSSPQSLQPPTPRLRLGVEGVDYSGRSATVTTAPTSVPTKFPQWDQSLELPLAASDISSSRAVGFTIEDRCVMCGIYVRGDCLTMHITQQDKA